MTKRQAKRVAVALLAFEHAYDDAFIQDAYGLEVADEDLPKIAEQIRLWGINKLVLMGLSGINNTRDLIRSALRHTGEHNEY